MELLARMDTLQLESLMPFQAYSMNSCMEKNLNHLSASKQKTGYVNEWFPRKEPN